MKDARSQKDSVEDIREPSKTTESSEKLNAETRQEGIGKDRSDKSAGLSKEFEERGILGRLTIQDHPHTSNRERQSEKSQAWRITNNADQNKQNEPKGASESKNNEGNLGPSPLKKNDSALREAEQEKLHKYEKAREEYDKQLDDYWNSVEKAKVERRQVNDFPPNYTGPAKPAGMDSSKEKKSASSLPTVNDMLERSKQLQRIATGDNNQPDFKVNETNEATFKQRYAQEATIVGSKYNLNKSETQEIVQSIYAFEGAGKITHDTLSGLPMKYTAPDAPGSSDNLDERRNFHPISTAIGYNQILMATNMRLLDTKNNTVVDRLNQLSIEDPNRAGEIQEKAKMIASLPGKIRPELLSMANKDGKKYKNADGSFRESVYADFARSKEPTSIMGLTGREITTALQALNLDRDIGPIIQAQQLGDILETANPGGKFPTKVQAGPFQKELAGMERSLFADASVFDQLSSEEKEKSVNDLMNRVPTPTGEQEKIELAVAKESLSKRILDLKAGKDDSLTKEKLGTNEISLLDNKLLSLRKFGEQSGPLSTGERALLDKLFYYRYSMPTSSQLRPAAIELANLSGIDQSRRMLDPVNKDSPTVNFFDRKGYGANPVTHRRTADELYKAIFRSMHGPNRDSGNYGMAEFTAAFQALDRQD